MPEPSKDEEIQTRTLSLCLFDIAGITVLNRCENCPGASRDPLQHRRCPREPSQPNIFRPYDADSKISAALKSSASSSKQHYSCHWRDQADTVLPKRFARLSLAETAGAFCRSESDTGISYGVKRKAKLDDREVKFKKTEVYHLSVQDYLKSKLQKPFRDLESENRRIPGCLRVSVDEMTALLMNRSAASPMDTQEYHPSGQTSSSRPFVPGYVINTELDGFGVLACEDGIHIEGCEMEF